jgi:transcriptional regulator with XRE-family HTH domain
LKHFDNGIKMSTLHGVSRLAKIVKRARATRSYKDFEQVVGVPHSTLRRIEEGLVREPEDHTLLAIAPHTPYIFEQLRSILNDRYPVPLEEIQQVRTAEDLMPLVRQLSSQESARLIQLIAAQLGGIEEPDIPTSSEVPELSSDEMAQVLRAIASRLRD